MSAACICGAPLDADGNCPKQRAEVDSCRSDEEKQARALLKRAADHLQELRAEIDGDMNDRLAMEIYKWLGET